MPKYIHSKLFAQEGLVMSELSERIGTAAGNAFKNGFNCGEAILQAFRLTRFQAISAAQTGR